MGTWGAGLYSSDFALDLRATIAAVARLPFDPDRLVAILRETEPAAATDPSDDEHATFWLVLADQFARRGIVADRVVEQALHIIDDAQDIATLERLGMKPADLRRRRAMLAELRTRITAPPAVKPRVVFKKPQPLLLEVGDAFVYPTCAGQCINPYFASKALDRQYTREGPRPWGQDGWGAAVIVDCGRVFEFLAWYRPLTMAVAASEKLTLDTLRGDRTWRLQRPGTCSPAHFRKMELETIGRLPVDPVKVHAVFPHRPPATSAAVADISLANQLATLPSVPDRAIQRPSGPRRGGVPAIERIEQILSEPGWYPCPIHYALRGDSCSTSSVVTTWRRPSSPRWSTASAASP